MIQIVYHKRLHRVTVNGHANGGEYGQDLVCATVSILAQTLAADVDHFRSGGYVRDCVLELREGNAEISCKVQKKYRDSMKLIFDSICAGFELLARDYPECVQYEVRG